MLLKNTRKPKSESVAKPVMENIFNGDDFRSALAATGLGSNVRFVPDLRSEVVPPKAPEPTTTKLVPINKEILAQAKEFSRTLPAALDSPIERTKHLFLTEIAPILLGVQTAFSESVEIVQNSIESKIESKALEGFLKETLMEAANIKAMYMVFDLLHLDKQQQALLMTSLLLKSSGGNNGGAGNGQRNGWSAEELVSTMQKILGLPRSEEEQHVPMRKVRNSRTKRL